MSIYNIYNKKEDTFNIDKNINIVKINNINYLLKYGFNSYYSDNIEKLRDYKVINKQSFKGKERVYKVLNPCNNSVNELKDNEIDIKTAFKNKYNIDESKQDFYKIYECIKEFELFKKNHSYLTLDKYSEKCITEIFKGELNNKTYDCIISNPHNMITTDQEKKYIKDFIKTLQYINNLKNNGSMIIKIYTTFSDIMVKLIYLLTGLFNSIQIYIPMTAEKYRNEKYLICKEYKKNENILDIINNIKDNNIIDIVCNQKYLKTIINMNINELVNQTRYINYMEDYLNKKVFYGIEYQTYREEQIKQNLEWIKKYI